MDTGVKITLGRRLDRDTEFRGISNGGQGSRSNENQSERIQRDLLFGVLAATAISAALLIAPSAWHRLRFRQRDKELILSASNRMAIAGLGFLALAMVGAVMLIANYAFSDTLTIVSGIVAFVIFGGLWYVLPLARRVEQSD
jgi:hypothetical protein